MADLEGIKEQAASYEEFLAQVVGEDYSDAKDFITDYHQLCDQKWLEYGNALRFDSLRSNQQFPMPALQRDVDTFVAECMERLFYVDRPVAVKPGQGTDKQTVDAVTGMIRFQDAEDQVRAKFRRALRDVALCSLCFAVNDWTVQTKRIWVEERQPVPAVDEMGEPVLDEQGEVQYEVDESGEPVRYPSRWVERDSVGYEGPASRVIDPRNVFFGRDKQAADDEFPIMIRSFQSDRFFKSKEYFFNADKVSEMTNRSTSKSAGTSASVPGSMGEALTTATAGRPNEYVEWQGQLPKGALYEWLVAEGRRPDLKQIRPQSMYMVTETDTEGQEYRTIIEIEPDDMVNAVVGVVMGPDTAGGVVVRCDEYEYGGRGPAVVCGTMTAGEDGLLALGLADRVMAVQRAQNDLTGMMLLTFKASLNRGSVVNQSKILNADEVNVNVPGWSIETNSNDLDAVVKFFQPPDLTERIMAMSAYFDGLQQDSGGMRPPVQGKRVPGVDTLGIYDSIEVNASKRIADYLRSFEDTFVRPFYRQRKAMSGALIDREYAIRVLGKDGEAWQKVLPHDIRGDVDFVCEASTRETQKAVLTQQILQLAKIAPSIINAGQPVRIDVLAARLCRQGFLWREDDIEALLPLLKLEKERGDESYNKALAENALLSVALQRIQALTAASAAGAMPPGDGGGSAGGGGGEMSQPLTEQEAVANANKASRPNVRVL